MASQITDPGAGPAVTPSFLYHLGDIAYTESGSDMTAALWNARAPVSAAHSELPQFQR
jgi:hypothetical protein